MEPEARRRQIAGALLAVAARDGLEAVSVRDVAAEAGVSAGMVQHHFKTKDEMLLFACEHLAGRASERIRDRVRAAPDPLSGRVVLRTTFEQTLPLTETRQFEVRVWIALLARAVVQPPLAAFMRQTHRNSHQFIASQLRRALVSGEIRTDIDPERETMAIFSLVEGLVSHVLLEHYTADQAMEVIDVQLDRIFG